MLHINDLVYRIEGRVLFDKATAAIPAGHKVGLVGRNGTGKTTLLRLLSGEIHQDDGTIRTPRNARIGIVAQEAPGGPETLLNTVLAADYERASLLNEAETATDPHRISEIQLRLTDIHAHTAPARAAAILAGLGFDEDAQGRACSEFSGGWRMRVALGAILFSAPDVLLLDEPSNYLDLEGTLWLETFLKNYPHTTIIVSHDRDLLNSAVGSILHLSDGRLSIYAGGYDRFEATRREQQRLQLKLKKKQDDQRRHMEDFVNRFRAKATKAKQAQSRLKALSKMKPVAAQIDSEVPPFLFPNPKKSLGNPLVRMEHCAVGYEPGVPILRDLDLRLDIDDRIGLLGANGNGKSTFAKLLSNRLTAQSGIYRVNKKIEIGYFAQHQMDEINEQLTPYDLIGALMSDATEAQKRSKLGQIGFGIEKANTKAEKLSGGEKARLLFALATFKGPHILILDEPTNHLDVDSREMLIHAINDYEGTVILISHDRHLIEACADRLWIVRGGTVEHYDGDMESYRAECLAERGQSTRKARAKKDALKKSNGAPRLSKQEQRRLSAAKRAEHATLRKNMKTLEKRVEDLTQEKSRLGEKLADGEFYTKEPDKAAELIREHGKIATALLEAEEQWLASTEAYEAVRS